MNKKPLVSVIMTAYNAEKYIEESINSIINQTYRNIELIVYLDGCRDNTEEIVLRRLIDRYDEAFKIIKEKRNKGCPFGRTRAIKESNGKYIVIQDADDISEPDRIEKQVDFLDKNKKIFCVGGFAHRMDEDGEVYGTMTYPPKKHNDIIDMIVKECANPIIDPTVMFRKDDFLKLEGYSLDKNIYTVPDFDLWLRAILEGKKIHNIQEVLTKYRIYDDSVTISKKELMIKHHMIVWRKFMSQYRAIISKNKGFFMAN